MTLGVQRALMVPDKLKANWIETRRPGVDFRFPVSFSIDCNKAIAPGWQVLNRFLYRLIDCN